MKKGFAALAAVCFGAVLGACVRDVVGAARAQDGATRYQVIGMSIGAGGYEDDLNKMTAQGWHFVGTIPVGQGSHLVFQK